MTIYEIPGKPIAWKRARINRGRFFDSQSKEKENYRDIIKIANKAIYCLSEPLKVKIEFNMQIPLSWSNRRRLNAIGPHTSVPDIDNLTKFCLDTFNGILWQDDAFIYELHARKCYAMEPKTRIYIEPWNKESMSSFLPF